MSTVSNWRGPNIIKDDLVLYVNANSPNSIYPNTSVSTWKDISGYGYNGTIFNTPSFDSLSGSSFTFDGTNEYVDFGTVLPINGSSTVTISMWVYVTTNTLKLIFSRYNTSAITRLADYVGLINGTTGMSPRIYIGTTTNYTYWTTTTEAVSLNTWTNLVFTINGASTDVKCYVNGVNTTLSSISGGTPPNGFDIERSDRRWKIASAIGGSGSPSYYDFKMSDLLVYNKTLSSTEVTQNYNSTKSRFGL